MTNEEAIKLIDDRMCFGRGRWSEHHRPVIDEYWQAGELAIHALEAEPHWIPVTERLPKPRESVIISVNGKYGDWIGEGCYWETTENHVIWKGYRWNATYWDDEIIAWMPLPEPFKGVTE